MSWNTQCFTKCMAFLVTLGYLSVWFVHLATVGVIFQPDTHAQAHTPLWEQYVLKRNPGSLTAHSEWPKQLMVIYDRQGQLQRMLVRGHPVGWAAKIDASPSLPHWVNLSLSTPSCRCRASVESRSLDLLGQSVKRPQLSFSVENCCAHTGFSIGVV